MTKIFVFKKEEESYPRNKAFLKMINMNYEVEEVVFNRSFFSIFKIFLKSKRNDYFLFLFGNKISILRLIVLKVMRKKIIIDFFISNYDTFVFDRKLSKKRSPKSLYYYLYDYFLLFFSDVIIFDTNSDANFFLNLFKVDKKNKKILILNIIIDLDYINSLKKDCVFDFVNKNKVNVLFYGKYIPLQGVEYIVKAANILKCENINFIMIGSGQTKKKALDLCFNMSLKNITFVDFLSYSNLIKAIKLSDFCLGIFGGSEKSMRVIPNKIIDYMACKKLVITGKNYELAENFKNFEDIVYCNMKDEVDLAEKISYIINNPSIVSDIGRNAYNSIVKFDFKNNKILL